MDKETQRIAWSCLPKEFKEGVKRQYQIACDCNWHEVQCTLEYLFGLHNLTSDADGETELLTVPRKDIVELYQEVQKTISQCKGTELAIQAIGIKNVIWSFFGSQCLPDLSEVKRTLSENLSEPKPVEPKFKVGDKIRIVKGGVFYDRIGEVTDIDFVCHLAYYKTDRSYEWLKESDLEPYTEPTNEGTRQEQCVPKNAESGTRSFDHILKDGFRNERRLNIAAMIMQGILSNPTAVNGPKLIDGDEKILAEWSLRFADALIAECNSPKN